MNCREVWSEVADEAVHVGIDEGWIRPPTKAGRFGRQVRLKSEMATGDILDDDRTDRF